MSFVHECNKNNRKDTKRNEFAWHSKILTNRLRFICLFINKQIGQKVQGFLELEKFDESANPTLQKELMPDHIYHSVLVG